MSRFRNSGFWLAVMLAAACLCSAGYVPSLGAAELGSSLSGHTITVGDAENGRAITLSRGDELVVSLTSNPSTGYTWRIARDDPARLKPLGAPSYERPSESILGGAGRQVFRFRAESSGTAALTLDYSRPWEKNVQAAKTYQLRLNVE
jgi:inhibitor of cysteine peptidase